MKLLIMGLMIGLILVSGCQAPIEKSFNPEDVVVTNAEGINSLLANCGLEMNTNRLSEWTTYDGMWNVEVYREVSLEDMERGAFPETFCIVYAKVDKKTGDFKGLDYDSGGCLVVCLD